MRKLVVAVSGLLSGFVISFFVGMFYTGLDTPLKILAIVSLWAVAFFFVVYALRSPALKPAAQWKPVRSVDEHGAEFMTEQEISYRVRRMYHNGKSIYAGKYD